MNGIEQIPTNSESSSSSFCAFFFFKWGLFFGGAQIERSISEEDGVFLSVFFELMVTFLSILIK